MFSSRESSYTRSSQSRPTTFAPPPSISWRDTRGAMNNQLAAGERSAARSVSAGQGLSRGAGQQYMQAMRGGAARADAFNAAMGTQMQDAYANANANAAYESASANENLAYRRISEQRRQGEWDSRFNNLTTIWGALSGLLR